MIKLFKSVNLLRQEYTLPINRRKLRERFVHTRTTRRIIRKSIRPASFTVRDVNLVLPDLVLEARAFQARNGFFPISFSKFSESIKTRTEGDRKFLSTTIPGYPYSFNSYDSYLAEYRDAIFAITHKKGGWDCYRHIEILESGCFPLMHDAKNIPEGSMFYYPKNLLAEIYENFNNGVIFDPHALRDYLETWFNRFLSSRASIRNMLDLADIPNGTKSLKCLFVDLELHEKLDYMSAMVLSGLMAQETIETFILGQAPRFMFKDFDSDSSELYGRGFGYTRIFSPESRRMIQLDGVDFINYDFVVVGSASRNSHFLEQNRENLKSTSLILIDGRDEPVDESQLNWLRSFPNANIFVRES